MLIALLIGFLINSTIFSNAVFTASLAALNLSVIAVFIASTLVDIKVVTLFHTRDVLSFMLSHTPTTLVFIVSNTVFTVVLRALHNPERVFLIAFQTVEVAVLIAFHAVLITLFIIFSAPFIMLLIALHTPDITSLIRFHTPLAISFIPCQANFQSPVKTPTRKSIIPLNVSATSPIILISDFITFIAVVPTTSIIFETTGSKFAIIQLIRGANTDSHRSFKESMSFPRNVPIFKIASPNGPSSNPLNCSASPCKTGRI